MVFSNIEGLVNGAGLPAPDIAVDVVPFAVCWLCGRLRLIELCPSLTNEQAQAESRTVKVRYLEESMRAVEEVSDALRVARVSIDELTAERSSSIAESEQAKGGA